MIPISNELNESLSDDNQIVRPNVKAWMSDLRSLDNLKVHSSSHTYEKQILDRDPQMYLRLDQTNFGAAKRISDCLLVHNGTTSAITIQLNAHGFSSGDEIVFTTDLTLGLPSNVKEGQLHYYNQYYVEVLYASYFYIHTSRSSAIAGTSGGRVVGGTLTSSFRKTISSVSVGSNATFTTSTNHGYSNGDAIVFESSGNVPAGIVEKDNTTLPVYYVQNATSTTFVVNTSYSNAINSLSEGIVQTSDSGTGTLTVYPIHKAINNVQGGARVQDYGQQAFDMAVGQDNTSTPIYNQTLQTYHKTLENHIQILEPNRLIDTFNYKGISNYLLDAYVSKANPAIVSYTAHGLSSGTPVMFSSIGVLSGINTTTVYYVDRIGENSFYLNTSYYNAVNKISTGRINTSASATGGYTSIAIYNGGIGFFTKSGSSDSTDSDMGYYSWSANSPKWTSLNNKLKFLDTVINDDSYYVSTFVNSLDHFVDFKVDSGKGRDIYTRFIDENNHVVLSFASTSYGYPIQITAYVDGNPTTVALIDPATLAQFSTTHYYRFQAKYNTYALYDMGTSEPTNATSGTLIGEGYFYHPKFRTDDAKRCGLGFGNQITLNPTSNIYTLECQYDYFAAYGYDSLSNSLYFHFTGVDGNDRRYLYSSTTLASSKVSQFQTLNNANNFSYSFYIYKIGDLSGKRTVFWLGNGSRETALRISFNDAATPSISVLAQSESSSYTVSSNVSTDTLLHVVIVKSGSRLSLYVDGVEAAYTTLSTGFTLKDIVTGETPYVMIGGDYAGTTLGDAAGYHPLLKTYLSEFAMFDYALTQADINAMYYSVENGAVLAAETVDDYCNAECIIDGQPEETLTFAFTNMLANTGLEIMANNSVYAPSPLSSITNKTNIEENYGWMSRVQSGSTGDFSNPDFIELTFDSAKCNKIFISTGYLAGRINSFDYLITKNDATTISGSKSFTTESYLFISTTDLGLELDEYLNAISIKITPTSTKNPHDYARIFSVNPIWEVDLSEYVISFSVEKVRDNYDASLPIGATAANNGSITFDNTDRVFNMFGDTLYGKYTTPDVPFFISLDHELTKYQTSEEIVLAKEMYSDTWTFSNSSMTTEVALRDWSKYLQEKTVEGYVNQGITAGRSIADLMMAAGFPRRKISYIDKYEEVVFLDKPKSYIAFNDTYEDLVSRVSVGISEIFDQCQYMNISAYIGSTALGKSLLYSESLSVQDESQRKLISNIESTFEPYYRQGSMTGSFSDNSTLDLFGHSTESWTTEIFHYTDIDNFGVFDTEITLMNNDSDGFDNAYNYRLYYTVSGSEITYAWAFLDNSNVEHRMTSSPLDVSIPHQIVIRKTGGSPNVFDLIIDGSVNATMSTTAVIKTTPCYRFQILSGNEIEFATTFVSNFSFYDYALADDNIYKHFVSASVSLISTYRYLYAADETYWDAMLSIATADLGMFYIDEYGVFRYEFRNFIHEEIFERYQNSQYSFSDDLNIIEGNYINEVQTNKITVAVKKISIESTATSGLWAASDGESLITGTLAALMTPESNQIVLASTTDPYWLSSGYVKIDDEIIRYASINGNSLGGLERGYFGTTASWHSVGSSAREVKYFNVAYSSKPAAAVKYPLVTNNFVDVDKFSATASSSEIIVSVNEYAPKNMTYLLSGTNALTNIKDYFLLAGVAVSNSSSEELVTDMSSEITSNLRRYGVKELKIDNPFIQNSAYAKLVADYVLGYYQEPVRILEMEILAVPSLQLGDLITVSKFDDLGIVDKKYWVVSSSISYDGGIKHSLSLRAYGDTIQKPGFTFGFTFVDYVPPSSGGGQYYPAS